MPHSGSVAGGSKQIGCPEDSHQSGIPTSTSEDAEEETAAAVVITGKMTDPRDLETNGIKYPNIQMPDKFYIDDSMFVYPPKHPEHIKIYRGPNIGDPPASLPMPDTITGEVTIKVEDQITTDHIIPAGSKMKYRSNVPKYSEFLFEVVDPNFYERAKKIRDSGKSNLFVAGLSYGQGSSREHAALCPMFMGTKAVIAKSFERIHTANLINFGIIPLTFKNDSDYNKIDQGDDIEIHHIKNIIEKGETLKVKNTSKNTEFEVEYNLSDRQREIILAGGTLAFMKNKAK